MTIKVTDKPNALGTFRYDVFVGARGTTGYRLSHKDAVIAAREDEAMLATAASMERAKREAEEERE